MSSNFVVFNPNCTNQESDAAYQSDPLVIGGATPGGLLPSAMDNKFRFAASIFIAAFTQSMVTKGYSPNDGSADPATALNNLIAVLANVITQADLNPYALLASPTLTGTPRSTTPPVGDNSTRIATTAAVVAAFTNGFTASLTAPNGYIKFPALLGGLIIQWFQGGAQSGGGENEYIINYPIQFPNACLNLSISTIINPVTNAADFMYQQVGAPGRTSCTIFGQNMGGGTVSTNLVASVLAIGY